MKRKHSTRNSIEHKTATAIISRIREYERRHSITMLMRVATLIDTIVPDDHYWIRDEVNDELTEDDELNLQAREEMMNAEADTEPDLITEEEMAQEAEALAMYESEHASKSIADYSRETNKTFFEIFK